MRKIKIAQIGINQYSHSIEVLTSIAKQTDLFEVVGYALPEGEKDRIPKKYEKLQNYKELTLDEILKDPQIEAVTIETDERHLTKYALLAAKAGKHIHMEKPGGEDPEEFAELIRVMKQTGKVLHIGYMYRYNPEIHTLMQRIKNGQLGEIVSVEAQMNSDHSDELRTYLSNFKGGIMFFLGCHLIDLILQLQGMPKRILPMNKSTGKAGINVIDYGMVMFEYDTGISFAKTCSVEKGGYARRQLVVTGTKGTVELKPLEMNSGTTRKYTGVTEWLVDDPAWSYIGEKRNSEPYDRYDDMMRAFAQMVTGEIINPYSLGYELTLYQTILTSCQ